MGIDLGFLALFGQVHGGYLFGDSKGNIILFSYIKQILEPSLTRFKVQAVVENQIRT
ncbi:hypothetical protein D3C81_1494030 [compost metagenome]